MEKPTLLAIALAIVAVIAVTISVFWALWVS
jgi:hypothetical protein